MTVNDLIKRLQQYPSDANVKLTFDYGESDCHACNVVCALEVEGYSSDYVMKASCDM